MFNLQDENISYVIINSEKSYFTVLENYRIHERLYSVLDSKDYSIFNLRDYNNSKIGKAYISLIPSDDNDSIRQDILHILEFLDINSAILKYSKEKNPILLEKNGNETPLILDMYPNDGVEQFYVLEGLSFSFKRDKRYFFPKTKEHLKTGMVVEYLQDSMWKSRQISDLDSEFTKMYSLLIKYNKLRIPIN